MINELIKLGNMYKAAGYAFRESGDEGICAFMRWEMSERYEAAEELAEHMPGPVTLTYARNYSQTQYDEVSGIVRQISRMASDPGAMSQYNIFLAERFGEQYNGCED